MSSNIVVANPRRRWLQFSLRTLLFVTLLLAMACGWLGNRLSGARRQARVVKELVEAGFAVQYDFMDAERVLVPEDFGASQSLPASAWARSLFGIDFFSNVTAVYGYSGAAADVRILKRLSDLPKLNALHVTLFNINDSAQLTDAHLVALAKLPKLKELSLRGATFAPSGVDALDRLIQLETLCLSESDIDDQSLSAVSRLAQLRRLDLSQTAVSDDGLALLKSLRHLEELDIHSTHVTDAGLVHVSGLTKLRQIYGQFSPAALAHLRSLTELDRLPLGDPANVGIPRKYLPMLADLTKLTTLRLGDDATDADLFHLSRLRHLEILVLSGIAGIKGTGFEHLSELRSLRHLYLDATSVNDEALVHLARLPALQIVELRQTRVTRDGVNRLRKALPAVDVRAASDL
jgi:hypothetical protein